MSEFYNKCATGTWPSFWERGSVVTLQMILEDVVLWDNVIEQGHFICGVRQFVHNPTIKAATKFGPRVGALPVVAGKVWPIELGGDGADPFDLDPTIRRRLHDLPHMQMERDRRFREDWEQSYKPPHTDPNEAKLLRLLHGGRDVAAEKEREYLEFMENVARPLQINSRKANLLKRAQIDPEAEEEIRTYYEEGWPVEPWQPNRTEVRDTLPPIGDLDDLTFHILCFVQSIIDCLYSSDITGALAKGHDESSRYRWPLVDIPSNCWGENILVDFERAEIYEPNKNRDDQRVWKLRYSGIEVFSRGAMKSLLYEKHGARGSFYESELVTVDEPNHEGITMKLVQKPKNQLQETRLGRKAGRKIDQNTLRCRCKRLVDDGLVDLTASGPEWARALKKHFQDYETCNIKYLGKRALKAVNDRPE